MRRGRLSLFRVLDGLYTPQYSGQGIRSRYIARPLWRNKEALVHIGFNIFGPSLGIGPGVKAFAGGGITLLRMRAPIDRGHAYEKLPWLTSL